MFHSFDNNFNTYWNSKFPDCPPVGHLLRDAYSDRWFRIHTLPEAKRYPQIEAEYAEVLRRHNALLADLFLNEQTLALLTTGYSATLDPVPPEKIAPHNHPLVFLRSIPMHEADEVDAFHQYWHIWLHPHRWRPQSLWGNEQYEDTSEDILLNPTIIIEVLSPSTEKYDRGKKFHHYRSILSLREYLLISQEDHHVERFTRQSDNTWVFSEAVG
jgi:hypothetical protein